MHAFEWYQPHAVEIKRDRNFVDRIKKGCIVFTDELNDLNVALVGHHLPEYAQLGDELLENLLLERVAL